MPAIKQVRKRDGNVVLFDVSKIADAIFKAASAIGGSDRQLADELANVVVMFLEKECPPDDTPEIEDIQDMVEKVLIETGHARTAKAYILYRQKRTDIRNNAVVRSEKAGRTTTTDRLLLVEGRAVEEKYPWDRNRIAQALVREADLDGRIALNVAKAVENRILDSGLSSISTALIRELVNNELFELGYPAKLEKQRIIGMPRYDLEQVIFSKSKENSNISANNPEAINLSIAEHTLKQYALSSVFSRPVADAHREGRVHLHDLGYPTRVYCSSHSLEYIKKYGLHLGNLDTSSAPAKHARTLTGHLNTFLASMQAFYAGALGVAYINVMYSPFVESMTDDEMRQEAQHLIFSASQNAFSRGGQTLFLDYNIHTGIPRYLEDVPAIGPGGNYTGRTYGEYKDASMRFTHAMLDVWRNGDEHGHIFAFPKCDFHVNADTFSDPRQNDLLLYACQIASENGVPYFIFDRDEVTLSACCRLRTKIEDSYVIKHPESLRFCGFQNVTVNLPQAAYRAGEGNFSALYEEIDASMDIALKAHVEKREFIRTLMSAPHMPLWEIGKPAADDRPYVNLAEATYIIGVIGLNECMLAMTGHELHESTEILQQGLKVIAYMYFKAKELGKRYDMKISLEESPAESASRRLAKVDLERFPEAHRYLRGSIDSDTVYYTNSVHYRPDADVDIITRIHNLALFHSLIESGAIVHAFVGEKRPSRDSIYALVRKTWDNTQAAQITISPEFTICRKCNSIVPGSRPACPRCGTRNIPGVSSITPHEPQEPVTRSAADRLLSRSGE
ncbi:MAG: anaerobic ribonucleoside-triphosphate reductase [Planctomycetes bacterium]|nr:anaerobic ribonucleoside-triphosphate reductase [Planctomycetota bacterium]